MWVQTIDSLKPCFKKIRKMYVGDRISYSGAKDKVPIWYGQLSDTIV